MPILLSCSNSLVKPKNMDCQNVYIDEIAFRHFVPMYKKCFGLSKIFGFSKSFSGMSTKIKIGHYI